MIKVRRGTNEQKGRARSMKTGRFTLRESGTSRPYWR